MGWGNCGTDSKGRPIGYVFPAQCDHPGCRKKIDRGLGYACGGMHGEAGPYCEGYFCEDHLTHRYDPGEGRGLQLCKACAQSMDEVRGEEAFEAVVQALAEDAVSDMKRVLVEFLANWDEHYAIPEGSPIDFLPTSDQEQIKRAWEISRERDRQESQSGAE